MSRGVAPFTMHQARRTEPIHAGKAQLSSHAAAIEVGGAPVMMYRSGRVEADLR